HRAVQRHYEAMTLSGRAATLLATFRASPVARPGRADHRHRGGSGRPARARVPPILARPDLLVDEGNELAILDLKTARGRPLARGRPVRLMFAVLTKTGVPDLVRHQVPVDRHAIERTKQIVARVWHGMQSGVI